ncbi:unnamed protein product [Rotaria sp. Silwood1]|nr:unnamed protein product [Rotaria sp. Silwood1]CAF1639480.1 unnamed protein product [Rotaria sp. Silwood1]CAF3782595.1 unnamed protein product [Rotaria sp. Silwood1]CAF3803292.1 unnamed protein product [Rotaria sp. Silwood1]CAF3832954.1 unnamed protein product [Rotaria sp. Silwood1]
MHLIDDTWNKSNENVVERRHLACQQRHGILFSVARVENVIEKDLVGSTTPNKRQLYRSTSEESLHSKFYHCPLKSNRNSCMIKQILLKNVDDFKTKSNLITQDNSSTESSHIQIQKLMDTIKEKDTQIAHLNQQYDQMRIAQLGVLQQVNKIVNRIINIKQQYDIKQDEIEQIKKELDFILEHLDNAKLDVQIIRPVISSNGESYYRSISENMDTSMQMKCCSIEYDIPDRTLENKNQLLENQLQQHMHQFKIGKKDKMTNYRNANEEKTEDNFQIKSEVDINDHKYEDDIHISGINQSNEKVQLKLPYLLRTDSIDAPCTAAEGLINDSALDALNRWLETQTAERRVAWALCELPGAYALSSSFGAQAAASLHLLTAQKPDIPVLLVDTGYLFPETYRFIDQLHERLQLNLNVLRPEISAAWFEARHGRLWEQGLDGIDLYNRLVKLKPMQLALEDLGVETWFAGLRRNQSESRQQIRIIERQNGRWKVYPIADWTDRDVGMYLRRHNLPYHPLWEKGYVSIGDVHTTRPWEPGLRQEDTRFFGLKRECGLHQHT